MTYLKDTLPPNRRPYLVQILVTLSEKLDVGHQGT